jgi:hypothetical protein
MTGSPAEAQVLVAARLAVISAHTRIVSEASAVLSDLAERLGAPAGPTLSQPDPDTGETLTIRNLSPHGLWLLTQAPFTDLLFAAAESGYRNPNLIASTVRDARPAGRSLLQFYTRLRPHLPALGIPDPESAAA